MEMHKILIVEDEEFILQDILALYDWTGNGYSPLTAMNGQQGLAVFQRERPPLVMTDIRMPHMDGFAMMRQIQRLAPDTRFIVLSAYSDFEYARTALKLGAADYLLKNTLSPESIHAALTAAVERESSSLLHGTDAESLSPVVFRAAAYIRANYQKPELRIGGISLACGISASRLSARFREEMNMSVNEYITFVRMETAKRLLAEGQYKVYEVADMVGYRNQAYFSTLFQKQTGVKPNKYHG